MVDSIDAVLQRSQIWVFDNTPGRGYGTNWDYTRLSSDLRGSSENEDLPWNKTVGPYLLNTQQREKIELGCHTDTWQTLEDIRLIDPQFPEYITKNQGWDKHFILLSHGKFVNNHVIARYFSSQKTDEFGRPGIINIIAIIAASTDYKSLLGYVRESPTLARKVFTTAAADLDTSRSLPGESDRPMLLTQVDYVKV